MRENKGKELDEKIDLWLLKILIKGSNMLFINIRGVFVLIICTFDRMGRNGESDGAPLSSLSSHLLKLKLPS